MIYIGVINSMCLRHAALAYFVFHFFIQYFSGGKCYSLNAEFVQYENKNHTKLNTLVYKLKKAKDTPSVFHLIPIHSQQSQVVCEREKDLIGFKLYKKSF